MGVSLRYKNQLRKAIKKAKAKYLSKLKDIEKITISDPNFEFKYRDFTLAEVDYYTAKSRLANCNRQKQVTETLTINN